MNPLQQSGGPSGAYNVPVNTGQRIAASSQPQHRHPDKLTNASLSPSAHRLLDQTETQGSDLHQLMALLVRNSVIDGTLTLQSRQDAHAHFAREVNIPGEINKAVLTVRVRLSEASQYDIAGIDLCSPLWSRKESFEAPAAQPLEQAAWSTPARRLSSAFPHDGSASGSAPLPGPARPQRTPTRSAPYPAALQSPGSPPTTVQAGRCSHRPGGVLSMETFVGCDITDDELGRRDRKAQLRVSKRRTRYLTAQALGLPTTGAVRKVEKEAWAADKGFPDRNAAERAQRDTQAANKGYRDRFEAQQTEKRIRAAKKGFEDPKEARRADDADRAARKGYADPR